MPRTTIFSGMSHDNNNDAPASTPPSPSITTTTTTVITSQAPTDRLQPDGAGGAAPAPGATAASSDEPPPPRLHGCVETVEGGALVCGWVKKLSGVPVGSPPEDDDGTPGKDPKRRR